MSPATPTRHQGGAHRTGRHVGRPANSDGDETRRAILHAARECFAANGYAATTTREVAERAGITTSGVYHHFGRKSDLMLAVYRAAEAEHYELWRTAIDHADGLAARADAVLDGLHRVLTSDPTATMFIFVARQESRRYPELNELGSTDHVFFEMSDEIARRAASDDEIDASQADAVASTLLTLAAGLVSLAAELTVEQHRAATQFSKNLFRTQLPAKH
ncbi:MAG: TetR/AcrR family transcriptional regulator [Solirubrobacteraceae bacterium]